jgi:hypothetical protein
MSLTTEQTAAVSAWVAAGDNLSAVQKKLSEQFQISMTYRDVRFLVDDLNLALKDPAPKVDTSDVSKTQPGQKARPEPAEQAPKKGLLDKAKEKLGLTPGDAAEDLEADVAEEDLADEDDVGVAPAAGGVTVTLDKVTLIPGAIASGAVTFSDGVTGKWVVDHQGRPGFTEISKPGYRPTQNDGQAFMQALTLQLQKRGY